LADQLAETAWAIRYWRPDARLAPYVSGYHDFSIIVPHGKRQLDTFFPGWANIRMTFDAQPWSIKIGRKIFDPVPENALFGPTSHAGYSNAGTGRLVGFGLTPAGWVQFFPNKDLSRFADQIVGLETILPDCANLRHALEAAPDVPAVLDAYLLGRLQPQAPENSQIAHLAAVLGDASILTVQQLSIRVGLTPGQLLRLAKVAFGFTPKLLLRRARFLRALDALETVERGHWKDAAAQAGYWDGSHFLRDCHLFMGQPLGDYLKMPRPINRASRQLRAQVLGAPMQSLHQPDPPA
jgi:AraC-like DNA-binding protein